MSIRPIFIATMFAIAALQQGFEIGAAETMYSGTISSATPHHSPMPKLLPQAKLSALGAATSVARIDEAFPATNKPGSIRSQAGVTAKSSVGRTRTPVLPSRTALAVVTASEPRSEAPTMKRFVDSQVMAVSYATPIPQAATVRIEPVQNSENPLRDAGSAGVQLRSTSSGASSQNATNPLR